jgi:hypothetical protein
MSLGDGHPAIVLTCASQSSSPMSGGRLQGSVDMLLTVDVVDDIDG